MEWGSPKSVRPCGYEGAAYFNSDHFVIFSGWVFGNLNYHRSADRYFLVVSVSLVVQYFSSIFKVLQMKISILLFHIIFASDFPLQSAAARAPGRPGCDHAMPLGSFCMDAGWSGESEIYFWILNTNNRFFSKIKTQFSKSLCKDFNFVFHLGINNFCIPFGLFSLEFAQTPGVRGVRGFGGQT